MPEGQVGVAVDALRSMVEVYPQLDLSALWKVEMGEGIFAAGLESVRPNRNSRRYVWAEKSQVTVYDGCCVDRSGRFVAKDAKALASHWKELTDCLEGQFAVARLKSAPCSLELITDFLGMEQVYYLAEGETWLISNSVELIRRIRKLNTLDALGVGLYLSVGWVGGDRTLLRDVRVVPGGQRWSWFEGQSAPRRETYLSRAELVRQEHKSLTRHDVENLAEELAGVCSTLSKDYGALRCALTGGRDSRLIAFFLISNGIEATYYTSGDPASADVRIGTQIAKMFGLTHEVDNRSLADILDGWDVAAKKVVNQHDGMVSLWQIADLVHQPSRIERECVNLWGIGGEIARSYYWDPRLFLKKAGKKGIKNFLRQRVLKPANGIVRDDSLEAANKYLDEFVDRLVEEEGIAPLDVPDAFYAFERVRRWGGSNARKGLALMDRFSLLCTRAFVRAAFSVRPVSRASQPLHRELTHFLIPDLQDIEFAKGPWRSQWAVINVASGRAAQWSFVRKLVRQWRGSAANQKRVPAFDQPGLLEAKLSWLRDLCLDQPASEIWNHVDRDVFRLLTSRETEPCLRRKHVNTLMSIGTLFMYASQ